MFSLLRGTVSGDKIRFKDGRFDLDLTYITENVIAMSFPASAVLEAAYRNKIEEVAELLNLRHGGKYCIWNVSERGYEDGKLGPVIRMGWPDHHAPGLQLLVEVVQSIDSWLRRDPDNVAVVHCMAGKGRTGTVIASYLLLKGYFNTPEDAIKYFGARRSVDGLGIEQPSQIRYINYYHQVLQGHSSAPRVLYLTELTIQPVPPLSHLEGCRLLLEIYDCNTWPETLLYSTYRGDKEPIHYDGGSDIELQTNITVQGDILIRAYHMSTRALGYLTNNVPLFRCSFNTAFCPLGKLELGKSELDIAFKERKLPENFVLSLHFADASERIPPVQATDMHSTPAIGSDDVQDVNDIMNDILELAEQLSDLNLPVEDETNDFIIIPRPSNQ